MYLLFVVQGVRLLFNILCLVFSVCVCCVCVCNSGYVFVLQRMYLLFRVCACYSRFAFDIVYTCLLYRVCVCGNEIDMEQMLRSVGYNIRWKAPIHHVNN